MPTTRTKPATHVQRRARTDAYLAYACDPDNCDPTGAFIAAQLSESDRVEYVAEFNASFRARIAATRAQETV